MNSFWEAYKIKIKLTNYKFRQLHNNLCSYSFSLSHWSIVSSEQVMGGFWNNFRNFKSHRRLSVCCNKLFEMRVTVLEGLAELKSDFKEESRNFIFTFLPKKAAN
jgi:hypothetical protein